MPRSKSPELSCRLFLEYPRGTLDKRVLCRGIVAAIDAAYEAKQARRKPAKRKAGR